ncbi:FxSxx-COOH system tetratricopeptide repeat protein [Actinoallomurus acaciae]|uniref:FxSxx-COOH system tetratricopeptide repeat protein n=1 Tax=Actinoallomurus acaciae TaxID=502577 RepID=A0ABV5YMJ2_9ACTN
MTDGQIVTFYSYKGGTGRTMALANVAWILAANGRRVLVADWDLESPGLHRFYAPFLPTDVSDEPGVIDMVRAYEWAAMRNGDGAAADLAVSSAQVQQYAFSLNWEFPNGGGLDFLSAGRQNTDYAATLSGLDWENFYDRLRGGAFFDALRADMKKRYDYVLIDSRTGLSDVADICTVHLPDILVDCFTLSTQGIEGAARIARDISLTYASRGIRILPVPMRVDLAEKERAEAGHVFARQRFAGLPAGISGAQRLRYWAEVQVPYQPFYAYEETLAVFGDLPGPPTTLLASFERLTGHITDGRIASLPVMDEARRLEVKARFARRPPQETPPVVIQYAPEDQIWADWIRKVLEAAGAPVLDEGKAAQLRGRNEPVPRLLRLISSQENGSRTHEGLSDLPYHAVYVADMRPLSRFSDAVSRTFLAGLGEREAIERLFDLLGMVGEPEAEGVRYPGADPLIYRAPARNARFTGREEDLATLRGKLRETGTTVVLPLALQGLGGVGKTQVALEYVHRFKSDYDLVWWIDCEEPAFVDTSLTELGQQIEKQYGPIAPAGANVSEMARLVLDALNNSRPVDRWLLVFDNAEEIPALEVFVPTGRGHTLITSRNLAWNQRANALPVDVFAREESIAHLCERAPSITREEADQVAERLGDLPLAVATAAAWLAETGTRVRDYLAELERREVDTLSISRPDDYSAPVARAWDLSLERLRAQSPAAARLFELCSILAPVIHLDLLYSPAMAAILEPYDPALAEPMVIGRVIQEISRLALLRLDASAGQVNIHRLVQAVVQSRMSPEELAETRRDIHRVLSAVRPRRDVDDPDTWERYGIIWPHLTFSKAVDSPEEAVRGLFIDRVRYLWQRGDLERGRDLARSTESTWQEMLAAETDPSAVTRLRTQILHLQFNLSNILRDLAQFEESRQLDEKVLAGQQELLGPEHPHTLMTAGSLSGSLRALGRYRRALDMDRQTYAAWSRLYGEDNPRTLSAANNLAVSYRVNGRFTESFQLDEDTYIRRRHTLDPHHPLTLHSSIQVARDLIEAGRYQEAASRVESVWESCRGALGAEHRTTLNAEVLLGVALRGTGRPQEARKHFVQALDGLDRRFGSDSSDALSARLSHSANMLALEELDAGEAETRAVRAVYQERLGDTHPHTLACQVNLASALRLKDEMDEALETVRPANVNLERYLGELHPYTLAATMVLAVLLADMGQHDQAKEYEELVVQRMTTTLGAQHPDTLRCRANLLLTRHELGDADAAREREAVIARLATLLDEGHPHIDTLRAGRRLVRAVDPQPF